jgi:hypothetical protein
MDPSIDGQKQVGPMNFGPVGQVGPAMRQAR